MITKTNELMELQRQRAGVIKMMNSNTSQIVSYIARAVGYNSFQDEKERAKNWSLAEKIFKSVIKDESIEGFDDVCSVVAPMCKIFDVTLQSLKQQRGLIEQEMIRQVKDVDVCDWWVSERGRSYLGLAIIIGEAGDLSDYANPAKLWKRFGLAVHEGTRQGGLSKNASAEQWIYHGYCPRRRSAIWTIGDSLLKGNTKEGTYYKIYAERKEYELDRLKKKHITDGKTEKSFKPGHAHNRAKRYMEKRLLLDLWNEWNN